MCPARYRPGGHEEGRAVERVRIYSAPAGSRRDLTGSLCCFWLDQHTDYPHSRVMAQELCLSEGTNGDDIAVRRSLSS